jgi:hypothetical protein
MYFDFMSRVNFDLAGGRVAPSPSMREVDAKVKRCTLALVEKQGVFARICRDNLAAHENA